MSANRTRDRVKQWTDDEVAAGIVDVLGKSSQRLVATRLVLKACLEADPGLRKRYAAMPFYVRGAPGLSSISG